MIDSNLLNRKVIESLILDGACEFLNEHRSQQYESIDLIESDPYGYNILEDYIKVPVWGTEANNSSATPFVME